MAEHGGAMRLIPCRKIREGMELARDVVTGPPGTAPLLRTGVRLSERYAKALPAETLERELRPGFVVVWFEGEEASATVMAERLVFTLEVWVAAMAGEAFPERAGGPTSRLLERLARAYGMPPSAFAASGAPVDLDAPNGIHFHAPAGILIPSARKVSDTFLARVVRGHLARVRELLAAAAALPAEALERPLRPGFVCVWFEGEEASAAVMAERLVFTLEVWVAAMAGRPFPERADGRLTERFERVAPAFERIARSIHDRGAWDDAFVDALCEPPQSFTYGGVLAHITHFGAIRTHALAGVLAGLGVEVPVGDPAEWEPAR